MASLTTPWRTALAVLVCAATLVGCGGDEEPGEARELNDHTNRLGWTVGPDGVGPLRLGWTVSEAYDSGLFQSTGSDSGCGPLPPQVAGNLTDPEAGDGVLYAGWAYDGQDHVDGFLVKNSSDFRTAEDIGVGSTADELREAYGTRLARARYDLVNSARKTTVPVVYGRTGALTFMVEEDRVTSMQVLTGRPGETLVNASPGGC